ncbi:hypothetical protein ACFL96_18370 [Thermoproteota archaeon]
MKVIKCPKCRSDNIYFDSAAHTGKYACKDCSYLGPLILEIDEENESDDT